MSSLLDRAQGCFLGQLIGDSLGSLVEFQSPQQISLSYPNGVRDLADGGTWNTIAGQPTDDSELALALARSIVAAGGYEQSGARAAYLEWFNSRPFDIGSTVSAGLRGAPNYDSQSNGGLMRISPLGIYAAGIDPDLAARYAREDAWITHPNDVTQDANVVFVLTIAYAIQNGSTADDAYQYSLRIANEHGLVAPVRQALESAASRLPESFTRNQGWVLIALQNAFYQLVNTGSVESALINTVGYGGDTDTTAAICGALLGAVHGRTSLPDRWVKPVLNCRPEWGKPGVHRPRPQAYWPVDALELAGNLLEAGAQSD